MSATKPAQLEQTLLRLLDLVPKVVDEYRWGWDYAYAAGGGRAEVQVSHPDTDPTLDTYQARSAARGKLRAAAKKVNFLTGVMEEALEVLEEISEPDPEKAPPPGLPYVGHKPIDNGMREGSEWKESVGAKRRREKRGEGWGQG